MSKDPAVLFYTSDFISGTLTMSYEQKGKYIILLCLQHQQGKLSYEDMINICGTYDEKIFSKFEKDEEGFYYNQRMRDEAEKRVKYTQSRKKNLHMTEHMEAHMENINENININKNELDKLNKDYGEEVTKKAIQYLSDYKIEKNYKTKSDYLTLKRWVVNAVKEREIKNANTSQGFKANSYRGGNNDRKLTPTAEEEFERIAEKLRAKQ